MSRVFEGDEWKYTDGPQPNPTRAEEQSRINSEYAAGKISRSQWSTAFDILSNVEIWGVKGRKK